MLRILTITVLLLSFSFQYGQETDKMIEKSHAVEIEGWRLFFNRDKEEAREKFQQALEIDRKNVLAKIGLFNTTPKSEFNENTYQLIEKLPDEELKGYSYSSISYGMLMQSLMEKEMPDSLLQQMDKYDEVRIKLKAALTDGSFQIVGEDGSVRRDGRFYKRRPIGDWNFYDYQDRVMFTHTYPVEGDTVISTYYKADGEVTRKRWIKGNPLSGTSTAIKELVNWQENPGRIPAYLFVSEQGYYIYDKSKESDKDEPVPDNIIGQKWDYEKQEVVGYITKNGKKVPYALCQDDGTVISETIGKIKKTYRWKDCKKILLETQNLD